MQEYVANPCTTDLYELGECCRWDDVRGELYWVDIPTGRFFRATANGSQVDIIAQYSIEGFLTALAPMKDRSEGWIVAVNQSLALLDEAGRLQKVAKPEPASDVRTNDGAADPWGRFWIGTTAYDEGEGRANLYRYHAAT